MTITANTTGAIVPDLLLTEIGGEPRARDLDIAERLGFGQDYDIRKLIKRHRTELATFGILATMAKNHGGGRGRPTVEYFLNEEQALLIAVLSEAEKAPAVRAMLIRVFVAWRRGHIGGANIVFDGKVTELAPEVRAVLGGIVKAIVHRELAIIVPGAVEAAITADPRRAALDLVSVRQLLDEARVPSKKRNSLNRKIGRELQTRALEVTSRGEASPHRRCAHTGVWLYARDFADRFMAEKGRGWVIDHMAAITGQTVIPFPQAARRRPEGDGGAPPTG